MYTANYGQEVPVIRQDQLSTHPNGEATLYNEFPLITTEPHQLKRIDLAKFDLKRPNQTYFIIPSENPFPDRFQKESLLIVEKNRQPKQGHFILALCEGEFIVRRFFIENLYPQLHSTNPDYPTIEIEPDMEFVVWGVIIGIHH